MFSDSATARKAARKSHAARLKNTRTLSSGNVSRLPDEIDYRARGLFLYATTDVTNLAEKPAPIDELLKLVPIFSTRFERYLPLDENPVDNGLLMLVAASTRLAQLEDVESTEIKTAIYTWMDFNGFDPRDEWLADAAVSTIAYHFAGFASGRAWCHHPPEGGITPKLVIPPIEPLPEETLPAFKTRAKREFNRSLVQYTKLRQVRFGTRKKEAWWHARQTALAVAGYSSKKIAEIEAIRDTRGIGSDAIEANVESFARRTVLTLPDAWTRR